MAYMNQEMKAKIAPKVKKVLSKYGLKGSLGVHNHLSLVLTIKSGSIDFVGNRNKNVDEHGRYRFNGEYDGVALEALKELREAMNNGNHDRSDIMTDYFDVGWYTEIHVGKWDKPYTLTK